jgi:DNA-directed RNA polymerase subunit RPC12/RpoP
MRNDTPSPEQEEAIAKFFENMLAHICNECGKPIDREKQVGRCVYAEPCGHRLFQGKASYNVPSQKTWKDHPYFKEEDH